jgi:hypothetical protein
MHDLELAVQDPRPTGRTAIRRLMLEADVAVADVNDGDRFRHVAAGRLDTVRGQLRREVGDALLDR